MRELWNYKVSVVMPIYQTTDYLTEAIESVVNQSIGIDCIQIILVINGADELALSICKQYSNDYPANIEYIYLEKNVGVSAARNIGKENIKGKYINFMDSDDKWDPEAFDEITAFFDKNYKTIDFVSARIRLFEGQDCWHGLDWKFTKDKEIIDINKDPSKIQLNVGSTFIKSSTIVNHAFDERVKHAEDAKFLTEIVLDKQQYGLVKTAVFYYRKRVKGDSVLQNVHNSIDWYVGTMDHVYKHLMQLSLEKDGKVIPYIQWLVMYEMQWRLPIPFPGFFTEKEKSEYKECVKWLLMRIDDSIILNQSDLWMEYKTYAICLKYGTYPNYLYNRLMIGDSNFFPLDKITYVEEMTKKQNAVEIKGFVRVPKCPSIPTIIIEDKYGSETDMWPLEESKQVQIWGEVFTDGIRFWMRIENRGQICFYVRIGTNTIAQRPYLFKSTKTNFNYEIENNKIMILE